MLNQEIAQRFIDRLDRVLDFNINIMDNRGIIIASRNPLRIGTFHEVAREVLVKGLSGLSVSRDEILPPGVRPGINLPVVLDGNPEGVIGVTGDAPELANVAAALKSSLETMLEYERLREEQQQSQDRRRILANALLFHDPTTQTQRNRILQDMVLRTDAPRIALVFDVPLPQNSGLTQVLQSPAIHGSQDLFLQTPDGRPVVFKALDLGNGPLVDTITGQVEIWVEKVFRTLTGEGSAIMAAGSATGSSEYQCFCGSLQWSPELYGMSYHHAVWTHQHLNDAAVLTNRPGWKNSISWFWDSSREYLFSLAAPVELESLGAMFDRKLRGKDRRVVLETLSALDRSGMGMKEAAAELGVHRNTLILRLEKIRQLLGLDPLNRNRDRILSQILCYRLARNPEGEYLRN